MGPSVSDYHAIDELVTAIRAMGGKMSLASMRADSISPAILTALIGGGARTITFAPEGGSQRMRDVINKNLTEDQILACADLIGRMGGQAIKMYFMIGLPGETQEDVEAYRGAGAGRRARLNRYVPGGEVQGSVTPHVPKSHTPFQWAQIYPLDVIEERANYLRKALRQKGVVFKIDSPKWLRVQGVLSRGDRRLSAVLAGMEGMSLRRLEARHGRGGPDRGLLRPRAPAGRALPLVAHRRRRGQPRARICSGSAPPATPPATKRARSWATPSAT